MSSMAMTDLVARADAWLDTFEGRGGGPTRLEDWLRPEAVFVERPNRFSPAGSERDVDAMRAGVEAGRTLLSWQAYDDRRHLVTGPSSTVTRATWSGELAADAGEWKAGTVMRAHIAMFLEFHEDGRIVRQENYDCYSPVESTTT